MRDATDLNAQLGAEALPNGFVSLPIFTFIDASVSDDVGYSGCQYAADTVDMRRHDNTNYQDYWWVAEFAKDPLAEGLGVPEEIMDEADFPAVYDYSDSYVARTFEGLPIAKNDTFDKNEYLEMRTMQKIDLTYMFSRDTRRLAFSRLLRKPLAAMQDRVDDLLGKKEIPSKLRYAIYSAHDDQISNMMEWLHATNVQMDYVLYASQVVFELLYDDACVASATASEACFRVNVIWNGHDLAFKECTQSAQEDGTGCSYADFLTHVDNIWYDGKDADDLDAACNQPVKPYGDVINLLK